MTGSRPILAIGGPTATGKTVLAAELAIRIGGELVNADSRQVVRRLFAGTATPTAAELRGVPCHLLGLREPGEPYTVAQWVDDARVALADLDARGVPAVLVGGTGQYLRALREGWDFGGVAPRAADREEITAVAATAAGLRQLAGELRDRDPVGAATVDLANPRRVIRAVELLRAGRGSLAEARRRSGGRELVLVVLDADRALHREVLSARLGAMFAPGAILAEVAAELASGTGAAALSRAGIGYREAVAVVEGRATVEDAREIAAQRTRRYVKAQRTWFRHEAAELRLERTAGTTTAALADEVVSRLPRLDGWRQ
jgi:tRNA dimethylallyltransferase